MRLPPRRPGTGFATTRGDMLKIECETRRDGAVMLQLTGEITGPWVDELRRVTDAAVDAGTVLVVDLTEVLFVDLAGVALLSRLADRRVALVNGSPFIAELLKVRT